MSLNKRGSDTDRTVLILNRNDLLYVYVFLSTLLASIINHISPREASLLYCRCRHLFSIIALHHRLRLRHIQIYSHRPLDDSILIRTKKNHTSQRKVCSYVSKDEKGIFGLYNRAEKGIHIYISMCII